MKLESQKVTINCAEDKAFAYISDLNNFITLLPDTSIDKKATVDTCSFIMKRTMTKMSMFVKEITPKSKVLLISDEKSGFKSEIIFNLSSNGNTCEYDMILDVDLNPMFAMMAKAPLQIFIDTIASNLKATLEQ